MFFNKKSFWDSDTFKTPYQQNITENEKIAGLSKFWSEVKYNFVNFDLVPSLNIDSLYRSLPAQECDRPHQQWNTI